MWNESDEAKKIQQDIDHFHDEKSGEQSAADASPDSGRNFASSWTTQLSVVMRRMFSHYNRDPTCKPHLLARCLVLRW
jgi:ATP-binding cassette subfamily G (WHITE) protein 2 (SNQ2)